MHGYYRKYRNKIINDTHVVNYMGVFNVWFIVYGYEINIVFFRFSVFILVLRCSVTHGSSNFGDFTWRNSMQCFVLLAELRIENYLLSELESNPQSDALPLRHNETASPIVVWEKVLWFLFICKYVIDASRGAGA